MTGHGLMVTTPAAGARNGHPTGIGYRWHGPQWQRRIRRLALAAVLRDIPLSCSCAWRYRVGGAMWVRTAWNQACPWHRSTP